jgi:hypothetical protein
MTASTIQRLIQSSPHATDRVLRYLSQLDLPHETLSGAALAAVCGVSAQRWRQWVGGQRPMPTGARRLLCEVAAIELPWVTLPVERVPPELQHADGDEVLVRLATGVERTATWHSGGYYDSANEPLEPVAVLALRGAL